jgi:hypothetical protein
MPVPVVSTASTSPGRKPLLRLMLPPLIWVSSASLRVMALSTLRAGLFSV